jgi:hypothetical protein
MPYEWDVFISYTRDDPVGPWVWNHFHPLLSRWLKANMPRAPRVFIDTQLESAMRWPDTLKLALLGSRCMVAVLSPPYFHGSRWCIAEWSSMRRREQVCRRGEGGARGLIHLVKFSDGDYFPDEAKVIALGLDAQPYNLPYPQYAQTPGFLDFDRAVQRFAEGLASWVDEVPAWQENWPILEPPPLERAPIRKPVL